jgi:hypothetical protein
MLNLTARKNEEWCNFRVICSSNIPVKQTEICDCFKRKGIQWLQIHNQK